MNNDSERDFAGTTINIRRGEKNNIHHSAAVSDAKFFEITARTLPTHCKKKDAKEEKKGIFRIFSKEVHKAITNVAIEYAPSDLAINRSDV